MKTGRTLKLIAEQLSAERNAKHDYLVNTVALNMVHDPEASWQDQLKIHMDIGRPTENPTDFEIMPTAHDQLSEHLKIPRKYYDRMRKEAPQLLAHNVNHWFQEKPSQRMLRTLDTRLRACMSNRYRPLDNADLVDAVMPSLMATDLEIASAELTDTRLYIKAVNPRVEGQVKVGDVVQAGVVISNSEVGAGALSVSPMLYRLACLNGMISADERMRRIHTGSTNSAEGAGWEYFRDATRAASDKAIFMQARDLVSTFLDPDYFARLVERMKEAAAQEITSVDLPKVVEVTSRVLNLTEDEGHSILKYLAAGGEMNKWGLANAITRTAQDTESYDRATELEAIGGRAIELNKRDWDKIATAV